MIQIYILIVSILLVLVYLFLSYRCQAMVLTKYFHGIWVNEPSEDEQIVLSFYNTDCQSIKEGTIVIYTHEGKIIKNEKIVMIVNQGLNLALDEFFTFTVNITEVGDTPEQDKVFINENLKLTTDILTGELLIYHCNELYATLYKTRRVA